jgi:hypothetical protein
MVRKNLWLPGTMADSLRKKSFETRRTQSDLIREALARYLRLTTSGAPPRAAGR